MIAFPATAAVVALICSAIVGWDALKRPRPERVTWSVAFFVFALAAGAEVLGSLSGWTPTLARMYYLSGAVLVVGLLALGEIYLLFGPRVPSVSPGIALLIVAIAITTVWSAPLATASLATRGWDAIERGPFLIVLAASINAGGTLVLVGGALFSAWKLRDAGHDNRRALGCLLIALGAIVVAAGGTLTRFGYREYLYLAMSAGITIIFAGVMLTRGSAVRRDASVNQPVGSMSEIEDGAKRARLVSLPTRSSHDAIMDIGGEGIRFIIEKLLPLDDEDVEAACLRWSATAIQGDDLTRAQATQVWSLRHALPEHAKARLECMPLPVQAQLAELYADVWSRPTPATKDVRQA